VEIIQIVPGLPPAINGVGDYAYLLARQLRAAHDIITTFVVCDPNWKSAEILTTEILKVERGSEMAESRKQKAEMRLDGFPVYQLKDRSATELLRVLSFPGMSSTVLLQYVGYGYEKRGCPLWLVRALNAWRNARRAENRSSGLHHLVTMFHELYATGPIWRSSFWTSQMQKWITKYLARLSEHCVTNRAASATWLATVSDLPASAISALSVFSNVGEPESLPDWNGRPPRMVVFGTAGQRRQVYQEHWTELEGACRAMNLEEIVDIGAPMEIPLLSIRVKQCGVLLAQEVSREMLSARAGFFWYPAVYLGKSGVFAAYAAHGLVPITYSANQAENKDGLKAGEHYLLANNLNGCDAGKLGQIGTSAHRWYQEHSTNKQAHCYSNIFQNVSGIKIISGPINKTELLR
jgi:hypothetical protein